MRTGKYDSEAPTSYTSTRAPVTVLCYQNVPFFFSFSLFTIQFFASSMSSIVVNRNEQFHRSRELPVSIPPFFIVIEINKEKITHEGRCVCFKLYRSMESAGSVGQQPALNPMFALFQQFWELPVSNELEIFHASESWPTIFWKHALSIPLLGKRIVSS